MSYESSEGLREVVRRAGSQSKIARDLGVTQQLVSAWVRRGWVSPERARELESLYGVPRLALVKPALADVLDPHVEFDVCENLHGERAQ